MIFGVVSRKYPYREAFFAEKASNRITRIFGCNPFAEAAEIVSIVFTTPLDASPIIALSFKNSLRLILVFIHWLFQFNILRNIIITMLIIPVKAYNIEREDICLKIDCMVLSNFGKRRIRK